MSTAIERIQRGVVVVKKAKSEEDKTEHQNEPGFWSQFEGLSMVFQMKGRQIISGTFVGKQYGKLKLTNATVKGITVTANVEWIFIEPSALAHFHPEGKVHRENKRAE